MYTGMGCGDQEMFRNCADVQINSVVGSYPPGALGHAPPQGLVYTGSADNGLTPLVVTARVCIATEPYNSVEGMMINCFLYSCRILNVLLYSTPALTVRELSYPQNSCPRILNISVSI